MDTIFCKECGKEIKEDSDQVVIYREVSGRKGDEFRYHHDCFLTVASKDYVPKNTFRKFDEHDLRKVILKIENYIQVHRSWSTFHRADAHLAIKTLCNLELEKNNQTVFQIDTRWDHVTGTKWLTVTIGDSVEPIFSNQLDPPPKEKVFEVVRCVVPPYLYE